MRHPAPLFGFLLLALVFAAPSSADADPERLKGRWKARSDDGERRLGTRRFVLERGGERYQAVIQDPRDGGWLSLSLEPTAEGGVLELQRWRIRRGAADVVGGRADDGGWVFARRVPLERDGRFLRDDEFEIEAPAPAEPPESGGAADLFLGDDAPSSDAPRVRVLITGFDRFPRLRNHPRWVSYSGELRDADPAINPSGWAVRHFLASSLDPELTGRVTIELHRLTDVPVLYVEGARRITDEAARVDADIVISFGVGSNGNADADVERTCENLMDDTGESVTLVGRGPFQLSPSWPPARPRAQWSDGDAAWSRRYPDNAGVSYNDHPIDPDAPDELTSTLPVDRIVAAVDRADLRAIDGGSGPGRYICNNVMFRVIQTQTERGGIGGFVHLAQWREGREERHLQVVKVAIEESVKAFLERPTEVARRP